MNESERMQLVVTVKYCDHMDTRYKQRCLLILYTGIQRKEKKYTFFAAILILYAVIFYSVLY